MRSCRVLGSLLRESGAHRAWRRVADAAQLRQARAALVPHFNSACSGATALARRRRRRGRARRQIAALALTSKQLQTWRPRVAIATGASRPARAASARTPRRELLLQQGRTHASAAMSPASRKPSSRVASRAARQADGPALAAAGVGVVQARAGRVTVETEQRLDRGEHAGRDRRSRPRRGTARRCARGRTARSSRMRIRPSAVATPRARRAPRRR